MGLGEWFKPRTIPDWLIVIFTFALTVVAILQCIITARQVEDGEKQFSVSHRPWVNISDPIQVAGPLVFDGTGIHVPISYILKNGGATPAIGVFTIISDLRVGPIPKTPQEARQIMDCGKIINTPSKEEPGTVDKLSNDYGVLLFPNGIDKIKYTLKTPERQFISDNIREVWFSICIRYKDENGDFHGTSMIWKFVPIDKKQTILEMGSYQGTFEQITVGYEAY